MTFRSPLFAALLLVGSLSTAARSQTAPSAPAPPAPHPEPFGRMYRIPPMEFSFRMPRLEFRMPARAWMDVRGIREQALAMAERARGHEFALRSRAMDRLHQRMLRLHERMGPMEARRHLMWRPRTRTI